MIFTLDKQLDRTIDDSEMAKIVNLLVRTNATEIKYYVSFFGALASKDGEDNGVVVGTGLFSVKGGFSNLTSVIAEEAGLIESTIFIYRVGLEMKERTSKP